MKTVFYLYHNGTPVNSVPLTENDISEIKKHKSIRVVTGRITKEIPVDTIRVVKRVIV